jgi:Tfp pilus assembly protein PilX
MKKTLMSGKRELFGRQGSIMLFSLMVAVLLSILGLAFFTYSSNDMRMAERQRTIAQAFRNSEAGIERAIFDLKQDFINDPTPSWFDGEINGIVIPDQTTENFYNLPYSSTSLNEGSYTVQLRNVAGNDREIWIRSTGVVSDVVQTIQVYVSIRDVSIWNNAIFGGTGQEGLLINGNSRIWGSVHLLGDSLASNDLAADLSGGAILAGNNYRDLPAELKVKVPSIGDIESLNSELRVKFGRVGLSGTASAGERNDPDNSIKETMDGSYVTDGYAGNKGTENVFSDNGWDHGYDLEDILTFPHLADPYGPYLSYEDYLRSNALVLEDQLSNIKPDSSFNYSNEYGSISMNGNAELNISGIVFVDNNNNLRLDSQGPNKTITYTGRGSIFVTGVVEINTDLVTKGDNSFPVANIIGIMTPNTIRFDGSQTNIMGLFYAKYLVKISKQTNILGAIVANYFDMGTNVPSIFQIPAAAKNLPPGMINLGPAWLIKVISWERV